MPKSPFRLEIPESVQLSDALIEKFLGKGFAGCNGKINVGGLALHQVSRLPRPAVECLAVVRVPSRRRRGVSWRLENGLRQLRQQFRFFGDGLVGAGTGATERADDGNCEKVNCGSSHVKSTRWFPPSP